MAAKLVKKQKTDIIEHAASLPSAEDEANVSAFSDLIQGLRRKNPDTRPQTWISRIGALLRQARANRGQKEIAKTAGVTQPYLSRLENGLLPKRGPTIDVLFRCAEAMNCDIEISMRSKANGRMLGHVSSADLDEKKVSGEIDPILARPADELELAAPFAHPVRMVNVGFKAEDEPADPLVIMRVVNHGGKMRLERVELPRSAQLEGTIQKALKTATCSFGARRPRIGKMKIAARQPRVGQVSAVVENTDEAIINIGENEFIVVGKSE
jgi:transcriptional regulator with XRE-family HTH domain